MIQKMRLLTVVLMMLTTNVIWAQPGGRAGGSGGGLPMGEVEMPDIEIEMPDIEVDIPSIDEIELDVQSDIDVDTASQELLATASAIDIDAVTAEIQATASAIDIESLDSMDFDADTFSDMMDNYEVPDDWSEIELTNEMPSQEDILAMADELPVDIDSLDIGQESSAAATSAIVGYASSMLNLTVTPLYAGEYGDSDMESSVAAQETINQIYSQLDADMQALLSQADSLSGITYWALLEDGMALVYTGDCTLAQCSISQDMVQVEITNGSAGAYAIYSNTVPSSADVAKALVQSTYPYLATIELSETESSYGTAFFAFDINMESQQVTAYYAGVYGTDTGQSIVYVVSGIGDAYINMLLGGS